MNENTMRNIGYIFNIRKPKVYFKIAKMYFNYFFLKKTSPRFFDVSIGYNCNLKCDHCFNKKLREESPLNLEQYKKFADEAMKLGSFIFYFQGGELFTIKGYEEIIKIFKPRENIIAVTSNGVLATEENLKNLKSLGVDIMIYSLDSGDPEKHDLFRGKKGTFEKVICAIELSKKMEFNVAVNTTLHHQNIKSQDTIQLFEMLQKYNIKVNTLFAAPSGNWHQRREFLLTEEDTEYYYNFLRKRFLFLNRDIENNISKNGCPAGKEIFYLDPYGNIFPCPFIHLSLGNIKNESFEKILKKTKNFNTPFFNTYSKKCLIAQDEAFIDRYIDYVQQKSLPTPCEPFFTQ